MAENEQDKPNPADEILGADYRDPTYDLQKKAWNRLDESERERLQALRSERDAHGNSTWMPWLDPDPEDPEFVVWMLKPVDPLDSRPEEQMGRWLVKAMTVPLDRAQAIVQEHRAD
jgi:hypothetical protein